ncbi:MAG: MmgE/PrpD family protein [Deltaproteobacteria bacterium]|nr:MmgE/PrpD family protein [Deltaproteobacteria bacterium]
MSVTGAIAAFAKNVTYEEIPEKVKTEAKRLLLDSLGCAMGGIVTDKGRLAIRLAGSLGGPEEASLPGTGRRVSAASAAYAFGELLNALDYEALLFPPDHATPYVLGGPLAAADMRSLSGKELILATAIAHEIALRVGAALQFGDRFRITLPERGVTMAIPTPGYGLCTLAGAAATARLWSLDEARIAHAMGIAGYQAPIPMLMKFSMVVPAGLPKYLSAGALSHQTVMAVMAADLGVEGDPEILDGDYGFWRGFGADGWDPDVVIKDLGRSWFFPDRLFYKIYPCCGAMQGALALFDNILNTHHVDPDDISGITVKLNLLAELPVWRSAHVENHIDAQFNVPYVFAVLARGIEAGPVWQDPDTFRDPGINRLMEKVRVITDIDPEANTAPAVEVVIGSGPGKRVISGGDQAMIRPMTDEALVDKFLRNTRGIIDEGRAREAAAMVMELESVGNVRALFRFLENDAGVHGLRAEE